MDSVRDVFECNNRCRIYRVLTYCLAESQRDAGYKYITKTALEVMRQHVIPTNDEIEHIKHQEDMHGEIGKMAHIDVYRQIAPEAGEIMNLGVDEHFILFNRAILLVKQAFGVLIPKLVRVLHSIQTFAITHKSQYCLSYTYGSSFFNVAKVTTVGAYASVWAKHIMETLDAIEEFRAELQLRSTRGINHPKTGNDSESGSLFQMYGGDEGKCRMVDILFCESLDFRTYNKSSTQRNTGRIAQDLNFLHETQQVSEKEGAQKYFYFGTDKRGSWNFLMDVYFLRHKLADMTSFDLSEGLASGDIPRIFELAESAIDLLHDVVDDGLSVSGQNCLMTITDEAPFMISGPIIQMLKSKVKSRGELQRIFDHLTVLASNWEVRARKDSRNNPNNFLFDLMTSPILFPYLDDIDRIIESVIDTAESVQKVERFCGPHGDVEKKLKAHEDHFKQEDYVKKVTYDEFQALSDEIQENRIRDLAEPQSLWPIEERAFVEEHDSKGKGKEIQY
ncbi:adenylosuccinate lyase [Fusarium austroafricanum]|uniref:Adenylosuccinate lyase n=1 Tax=Fusarium austroafricanum TaxID=2364996 RepID=A0A8H4KAH0_9HYPO|nr:adenylosuccinate lyase [Fusarium austroafricanum]